MQASNHLILNPRHTDTDSLLLADAEWIHDLSRYLAEMAYQEEQMRADWGMH